MWDKTRETERTKLLGRVRPAALCLFCFEYVLNSQDQDLPSWISLAAVSVAPVPLATTNFQKRRRTMLDNLDVVIVMRRSCQVYVR